jgi:hypothetical protein
MENLEKLATSIPMNPHSVGFPILDHDHPQYIKGRITPELTINQPSFIECIPSENLKVGYFNLHKNVNPGLTNH